MIPKLVRLGIVGMGLNNMASTFALVVGVPDLRYRKQAVCTQPQELLNQCLARFSVPYCPKIQTLGSVKRLLGNSSGASRPSAGSN